MFKFPSGLRTMLIVYFNLCQFKFVNNNIFVISLHNHFKVAGSIVMFFFFIPNICNFCLLYVDFSKNCFLTLLIFSIVCQFSILLVYALIFIIAYFWGIHFLCFFYLSDILGTLTFTLLLNYRP